MANNASGQSVRMGSEGKVSVRNPTTGSFNLVARLTQWSINTTCSISEWGDSDSRGFTCAKAARKGATGTMEGKLDSTTGKAPYDLFVAGDNVSIQLWEDASDTGPSESWYIGSAVIGDYSCTYDQDSKEAVGWTASFTADGVYFYPDEADNYTSLEAPLALSGEASLPAETT